MKLVTRLVGGLGNQLFQYCAALHYSDVLGAPSSLVLRTLRVSRYPNIADVLRIDLPMATTAQRLQVGDVPDDWPKWKRAAAFAAIGVRSTFSPVITVHDAPDFSGVEPVTIPSDTTRVLLHGSFQSAQTYEPHLDDVCRNILEHAPEAPAGRGDNRVALSFRRGDYVPLGWTLTWSYYAEALRRLGTAPGQTPIWVVSDDVDFGELAAHRLRAEGYTVEPIPALDCSAALNDFWALAHAESVVLSNSTFAWWAAAVGDVRRGQEAHRVAVPRPWLPTFERNLLCRSHWTPIEVTWQEDP